MSEQPARGRGAVRRARRRQQVRWTALVLGVLLLLATAFAVWLAVDARGPVQATGSAAPGPGLTV